MSETVSPGRDPSQRREMVYRMRAQLILGDDPRYTWLCDRSEIKAGKPKAWRPQVLSGLGRLLEEKGPEAMLELANQLCREQPSTRQALTLIRERRLEGGPQRFLVFSTALIEAAERFLAGTPALSSEEITAALDEVRATLLADLEL